MILDSFSNVEKIFGGHVSRVRVAKKNQRISREKNPFFTFSIGMLAIAITCVSIVVWHRSPDQKRDGSITETIELNSSPIWKLPPATRKLGVPNLPGTPQLREVLKSHKPNAVAGYEPESLLLKLNTLIENHPIAIVRTDLNERLKAGTIFVNWQIAQGLYAQFRVVPSGATRMLVLSFDPQWLASVKTSDEIYLAFLVIFHEYVHFQQYERGDEKVKLYFSSTHVPQSQLQITKEDLCRQMWSTEKDAYTQECRVANEWGYPLMETFCLYVDTPTWSHVIFNRLYQNVYLEERVKRICGPIFAELAEHPHPELL